MPYTLVTFHAHPDDEAITTGGIMARAAAEGHRVVLVVATRGELGEVADDFLDRGESLAERRVVETQRAADALGVARVEFLGYTDSGMDGEATNDAPGSFWSADVGEAADRLAAILEEEHADVLTVYDDHGGYGHPDHVQVHRVGIEAASRAGTPRVYESTMNRDHVRRLMEARRDDIAGSEDAPDPADFEGVGSAESEITTTVDVRAFVEHKRAAMRAHASQIPEESFFLSMPDDAFREAFGWEWLIRRGTRPAAPETGVFDGLAPTDAMPHRFLSLAASIAVALTLVVAGPGAVAPAGAKGGPAPYAGPGPYAAGVTTLDMDGVPVEVWYPVDAASVAGKPKDVYHIRDSLPPAVQALIPASVNPPFTEDAYRDVPATTDGPFPLVLFSHGFAGIRLQSTFLTTHLAQWGFVVASPEFESRNLASVLGAKPAKPRTDTQVLAAATRLVRAENTTAGSVLAGVVKRGKIAVAGHSAGGFAAIRYGGTRGVATYIPLSAGGAGDRGPSIAPPDTPSLYALGGADDVVGTAKVERYWERRAKAPKRLVVIDGAGHTSPTDLCDIGNGGLVQTAIDAGVPIPPSFGSLYDCVKPVAPHDTWPVYDHFVTAQLRWAFGIDRRPVGLDRRAARSFLPVVVTYRQQLTG